MSAETPNRAPSIVWALGQDFARGYVRTLPDDLIYVVLPQLPGSSHLVPIELNRADARLLAKRLNQCLDETRKR